MAPRNSLAVARVAPAGQAMPLEAARHRGAMQRRKLHVLEDLCGSSELAHNYDHNYDIALRALRYVKDWTHRIDLEAGEKIIVMVVGEVRGRESMGEHLHQALASSEASGGLRRRTAWSGAGSRGCPVLPTPHQGLGELQKAPKSMQKGMKQLVKGPKMAAKPCETGREVSCHAARPLARAPSSASRRPALPGPTPRHGRPAAGPGVGRHAAPQRALRRTGHHPGAGALQDHGPSPDASLLKRS